jgi:hypothetical protein
VVVSPGTFAATSTALNVSPRTRTFSNGTVLLAYARG